MLLASTLNPLTKTINRSNQPNRCLYKANTTPSTNRPRISFRFAYDDEDEDDDYYGEKGTNHKVMLIVGFGQV